MKRLLLVLLLAVVAVPVAIPATAGAAVPCRNKIYNDWYGDGKIASTYPISCYRDALKHMRAGDTIYSSLSDDIHSALQAAIERSHGKAHVPAQVGRGLTKLGPNGVLVADHTKKTHAPPKNDTSVAAGPVADSSSGGSGVPLPLLVLGGVAILLAAAGGLGMIARHRRGDSI
jgi:hypothetical protein